MSSVDKLITELCPEGVPFLPLRELLSYEQPTKYLVSSKEYDDSYHTPVLTPGQTFVLGYTSETTGICDASPQKPVILFDDFTTAFRWIDFPFKVKSSAVKLLRPRANETLNFRFVYYAMKCIHFAPSEHSRHWISKYSEFRIQVPPVEVQNEIVRILDTFTALEAELEAELGARRAQYTHYRTSVLDKIRSSAASTTVTASAHVGTGSSDRQDATERGRYPLYVRSRNVLRTDSFEFDDTAIVIPGEGGIGDIFHYVEGEYALHQRAYRIVFRADSGVHPRFAFHVFQEDFKSFIVGKAVSATVSSIRKPMIEAFSIPVPPLAVQIAVAERLDAFSALVEDISFGLPAEIAARRQQYEHYRERLLTFKELGA